MDLLPVFMALRDRSCLVVGGGPVAARKAELLLEAGARVTVVAPALGPALATLAANGRVSHHRGRFAAPHVEGRALVVAATDDPEVNAEVSRLCRERNLPVNVVDNPALCGVVMPAIIDRSPVLIALTTGGASPVLARLLRGRLESLIPAAYGRLAALCAEFRHRVQRRLPAPARRGFWESILQGPVAEQVFAGREAEARTALEAALEAAAQARPGAPGEVYLVGGGPGDPDLLTFRALRLMQQADVVVHDRLVSRAVLDLTRRDAERIDVGKTGAEHRLSQQGINALLIGLARRGRRVLRLKGGDPFVFGRGGEELAALARAGIPVQVVPGVTAANGCAAYAGIPLTHRDCADSLLLVTAHRRDGALDLPWEALVRPRQTLVFYMGTRDVADLCAGLTAHGMPAATPAALVERGTLPDQRISAATLADLPGRLEGVEPRPPALLIVGAVVGLGNWSGAAGCP